jgi:hypothetical protein
MPRGKPHRKLVIRLDQDVEAEARVLAGPKGFSAAVTEGLRWWIARERRRQGEQRPARKRGAA